LGWAIRGDWISDDVDSNWTVTPVNETPSLGRKRHGLVPRFKPTNRYKAIFQAIRIVVLAPLPAEKNEKKPIPRDRLFRSFALFMLLSTRFLAPLSAGLPHILGTERET